MYRICTTNYKVRWGLIRGQAGPYIGGVLSIEVFILLLVKSRYIFSLRFKPVALI